MLASYNRYTFKPHHFILVHDVFDNVEFDAEQYDDDDNFECNKENDAQFTWDFPINSSNLFHSSNISLESLNMKNAVKSKLGSKKVPLQEQIKKHNADVVEAVCGLRIEDFAKVGNNCARLNLESVISRKNSKKQQTAKSLGRTDLSNQEQLYQTDESIAGCKKNKPVTCELSNDSPHRVACRPPDIPHTVTQETSYHLSRDPVSASTVMHLPSLAEELKAALLAENPECISAGDPDSLQNLLPVGFHLNLLSLCSNEEPDLLVDILELGSPEQIDPVNKYNKFFNEFGVRGRTSCRKSCCFSESDSDAEQTTKKKPDVKMSSAAVDDGATGGRYFTSTGSQGNTADQVDFGRHVNVVETDRSVNILRNSADQGTEFELGLDGVSSSCNRCVEKDDRVKRVEIEEEKSPSNNDFHQNSTCSTATGKNLHPTGGSGGGCTLTDFDLDEADATHRGCHKFVPRHLGELAIEIGDYIYVQVEDDDLWCEGINLRTKQRGIFPTAYAMDLSLFNDDSRNSKFFVKYLGSIEVGFHKGDDVLCQAINKLAAVRSKTAESNPPPRCCLEITEHGVKMTDRSAQTKLTEMSASSHLKAKLLSKIERSSSAIDHLFLLKNISFCGFHPKDDRYFGFITKHPLEMRFACHVFQSDRSSKVIAEAIGDAFRKFYQEYLAYVYPTEDIYME